MNIFKIKETWIMIGLFLLSILLMVKDPFNLNPEGFEGTTVLPALYLIPSLVFWFFYFVYPTSFAKKGIQEDIQSWSAKIASVLKVVLSSLTTLVILQSNFNIDIPYLDVLLDLVRYIASKLDTTTAAIGTIIGAILGGKAIVLKEDETARYIQKKFSSPKGRKYSA